MTVDPATEQLFERLVRKLLDENVCRYRCDERPERDDRVWFGTAEAAKYTGHGVETLKRAVTAGALKSSQATPGGWHRFHREWLDEWMASRGGAE